MFGLVDDIGEREDNDGAVVVRLGPNWPNQTGAVTNMQQCLMKDSVRSVGALGATAEHRDPGGQYSGASTPLVSDQLGAGRASPFATRLASRANEVGRGGESGGTRNTDSGRPPANEQELLPSGAGHRSVRYGVDDWLR